MLEEELAAVLVERRRGLADRVDEARPGLPVGRLERVVVALDPRPDDEVRADLAGELAGLEGDPQRVVADGVTIPSGASFRNRAIIQREGELVVADI